MKLILYIVTALFIFSCLGFAAPFKQDTISAFIKSNDDNACYIQEFDISGTQVDLYQLPNGYSCDIAGKIAQLDSSGSILVVPMVQNAESKIITLDLKSDIVDTTTLPGAGVYSGLVSGNDMWFIASDVGYTTRGSSGPVTQNIVGFPDGNPPLSRSGQLVGNRLLYMNFEGTLWQINPVVKTGTGSVTKVQEGLNGLLVTQFYVHKTTNLYTYFSGSSNLNKYSFVDGAATRQYSLSLGLSVTSLTAIDVNNITYVLISYKSGSTHSIVRLTDTGSSFTEQINWYQTTVAEIRSVSPSPRPSCSDGFINQDETDVDCGGDICTARCNDSKNCSLVTDCTSNYCNPNNECSTPACDDGFMNQNETDVDCGGDICTARCANTKSCSLAADCTSNYCNPNNKCSTPACDDGFMNQDETDIDCGGNTCSGCAIDKKCAIDSDCAGNKCLSNLCAASCLDNILNQDETDTDCGGSCGKCGAGKLCNGNNDCSSSICDSGSCTATACDDNVMNGAETDIDCGGGGFYNCTGCAINQTCAIDGDCAGLNCVSNLCAASCQDNILNQDETDMDCGGSQCVKCPDDKICLNNNDCNSNFCAPINLCKTPTCQDTYQNQDETDIDCGGSTCSKCAVGKKCVMDTDSREVNNLL